MSERDEILASQIIANRLRDPAYQDRLAVTRNRETGTSDQLAQDLTTMNDAQIRSKYGDDVYLQTWRIGQGASRLEKSDAAERDTGEMVSDAGGSAIGSAMRTAGNFSGLMAGQMVEWATDGDIQSEQATADILARHNRAMESVMQETLSEELQEKQYFFGIEGELDALDNQAEYEQDIEKGMSPGYAALIREGKNAMDSAERAWENPAVAGALISEGIGDLAMSAPLGGAAGLVANGASKLLVNRVINNRVSRAMSRVATGAAYASGESLQESVGVYAETVQDVMNLDLDVLQENSSVYRQLLAEGFNPEEARSQLAGMTAETAAIRQIPSSVALGFINSRFEAMPIGAFRNVGVTRGILQIAGEGIEEAGQGATGTMNRNLAVEEYANIGRDTMEGVGEETALGAIAGMGVAGVAATPAVTTDTVRRTINTPQQAADALFRETQYQDQTRQDIMGGSRASNVVSAVNEVTGPIVQPVRDRVAPVANKARTQVSKLSGVVSERVQEYANRPSSKEVSQSVESAAEVKEDLQVALENGQLEDTVVQAVSQPDTDVPSASFADVAGGNNSLMDNITGITAKLGSKNFRASNSDTAYAAAQYQKLRSIVGSLPKDLQNKAGKILSSKLVQEISAKAEKLDLNRNPEEADLSTTVNVAKTNPANVNPDVADQILEESGEEMTPEDARYVRVASKIGRIVNRNLEKQVEIRTNENINLTQASRPKKQDLTVEGVSRQIHAEGKTDSKLRAKYRSINDFARDILSAVQSGEQTGAYPPDATVINQKGQVVPVRKVIKEMANFAQHMKNKVQALNDSINDGYTTESGLRGGRLKDFDGLVNGKFQNSSLGSNNLRGVRYSPDNPNSVAFAQQVEQDQNDLIDVYNILREEFPETFGDMPAIDPVVLTPANQKTQDTDEQPTGVEETSDAPAEEATSTNEQKQQTTIDPNTVAEINDVISILNLMGIPVGNGVTTIPNTSILMSNKDQLINLYNQIKDGTKTLEDVTPEITHIFTWVKDDIAQDNADRMARAKKSADKKGKDNYVVQLAEELIEVIEVHDSSVNPKQLEVDKRNLKRLRFGSDTVIKQDGPYKGMTNQEAYEKALEALNSTANEKTTSTSEENTDNRLEAQFRFTKAAEVFKDLILKANEDPWNNKKYQKKVSFIEDYMREILGNRDRIASLVRQSGVTNENLSTANDILSEFHIAENVTWPFDNGSDFKATVLKDSAQDDLFAQQSPTADEEVSNSENGVDETEATAEGETTTDEEMRTDESVEQPNEKYEQLSNPENWIRIERVRIKAIQKQAVQQINKLIDAKFGKAYRKRVGKIFIFPQTQDDTWGYAWTPEGQKTGDIFISDAVLDENGNLTKEGVAVVVHEMAHVIDFTHTQYSTDPSHLSDQNQFQIGGVIDQEWQNMPHNETTSREEFYQYVESFEQDGDPVQRAAELFAVLSEYFFAPNTNMFDNAPETLAFMEEIYGKRPQTTRTASDSNESSQTENNTVFEGQDTTSEIELETEAETSEESEITEINGLGETTGQTPVNTHPMVNEHFETRGNEAPLDSISDLENAEFNQQHVAVVRELLPELAKTMNNRLQEKVHAGRITRKIIDHLKAGWVQFPKFKAGAWVNPETGTWDNRVMDMAAVVITDFITTAAPKDPNKLEDTLEELGVTINEISDESLNAALNGLPPSQLKDQLASDFVRLMNLREKETSGVDNLEGIAQGFAAELITAMDRMGIVEISSLDLKRDAYQSEAVTILVNTDRLKTLQNRIRSDTQKSVPNTVREGIFLDKRETYSIGKKIRGVATRQSRGNVALSELERRALKQMQDTPHYVNEARLRLLEAMGDGPLMRMLGWTQDAEKITHRILRKSAVGKNASIDKNIREVVELIGALAGDVSQAIYYPVGITKVGRHQYQGPNPQSNKLLRFLATPTWSTINFESKDDMDAFWLGVAQASGLAKVEKVDQTELLETIKEDFAEEFGPAVVMLKELMEGGVFDANAFATTMGPVGPEVLGAVEAVASMEIAQENGQTEFRTSLSFELDGLTNGAANMMVNYGHGLFTADEWENLRRVGLYLGEKGMTVNQYFKDKINLDLYETVGKVGDRMLALGGNNLKPWQKEQRAAAQRLATSIGNFEMVKNLDDSYSYKMTRNTAKNPMTKVNYGSGVLGVAVGVADDMLLEFYQRLQTLTEETSLDDVFYTGFEQDMATMGLKLPNQFDENFVFSQSAVENFRKSVMFTIGRVLTDSTREVLGNRVQELNDMLVLSTNIQNRYLQKLFDKRVDEMSERLAKKGVIGRNKKGKPNKGQIPRAEWKALEDELAQLGPIFRSDDQTIAIGGFEKKLTDLKLSRNFNEELRAPARMRRPDEVGVRAIPFSVIGTGDAMMMNLIFGSDEAPDDVLGIFDGLDVPVTKVKKYAPFVNQQVLKSWDRDVLSMPVMNFEAFLGSISNPELLKEAESEVLGDFKKETVQTSDAADLLNQMQRRLRENRARKKVMKQMTVSVDQMGGSDVGYSRDGQNWDFHTVNQRIQREMEGRDPDAQEQVTTPVRVLTGKAVLENTRWTSAQKKVVEILKPLMGETRVVFGTLNQLNEWRGQHLPQDGAVLKAKGQYDAANDVMFMTVASGETLLHELVHAATYNKVLQHYQGDTNQAVVRLESLMAQFLELDGGKKIREAQAAINRRLVKNTPVGNANALNEFMAYAMSSSQVRQKLEDTQANVLANMKSKVIQLLRKLMGGVPSDMFSQVVFNTRVLNGTPPPSEGGNGNGSGGDDGGSGGASESSDPFGEFTNYWIQNLKDYMQGLAETADPKLMKTSLDLSRGKRVLENLRQAGMLRNNKDKATFKAIYGIVLSDMKLNSNALIGLTKVFAHVEDNLTSGMFGEGSEAGNTYSAVLNALRESSEPSHSVAVLFALSQTSQKFRDALDQIPAPQENEVSDNSLNEFLTKHVAFTMQNITGSMETNKIPNDVLATIAGTIIDHDMEREFRVMRRVTQSLDAADEYVSGKFSQSAEIMRRKNREMQASTRSDTRKYLVAAATFATNYLDKPGTDLNNKAVKHVTHMGIPLLSMVPIRELVSEMVGTDAQNKNVVALLDRVNAAVSGMRQAFREDLPGILERSFKEAPTKEQWISMFKTLAKSDFSTIVDLENMQGSMRYLEEQGARRSEMQRIETQLQQSLSGSNFQDAIEKGRQLAAYMNGQSVGKLLIRNAYAITKNLEGNIPDETVELLDRWITLEAVDKMDSQTREETVRLWQEDPVGILGVVAYLQQLNEAEKAKVISEQARLNGYKGYIPNEGAKNVHITVAPDSMEGDMERKGYKKMNVSYTGETDTIFPQSYYVSTVRRQGIYSQGVVQNVAMTYRGVDVNTGLTVKDDTAGFISGEDGAVQRIMENQLNESVELENEQEALMPVFGPDGDIIGFERSISQEMIDTHMGRDENLAVMLGAWQGRQVEEGLADQYNKQLADELKRIWDNREAGEEATFVNLKETNDPIYKDSWSLVPQSTKLYMETLFGDDGVMVPKSMVNLSVGYREFSLADMWSGKTRLPKEVQAVVKGVSERFLGTKAMRVLTIGEELTQGIVSTAKDIIVIRSLVVPMANLHANVIQLATRGVPTKTIIKSFRQKLAEVEEYNKNRTKVIDLEAKKMLLSRNNRQRQIIDDKIKVLEDLNQKMSIAPILEAGAYKQLSEGITDMDVAVSSGRIGDYMETLANKLPEKAGDIAKMGLVSKSTKMYQVANRATQYGDFLSKSIYYDHLLTKGLSEAEALSRMNEEFVNFSVLPGRTRSALEGFGLLWFMAFKLRITKIAMQQLRDNPIRAMAINGFTDVGSPVEDNILSVIAGDRLGYATGFEMLFDAPELNPWINLMSN